jgi:hypothetical protein
MKASLLGLLAACGIIVLGGCTAAQIQTAGANVATINGAALGALQTTAASISSLCPAGQTILNAAAAASANPSLVVAQDANGVFCAVNKTLATSAPAVAASAPVAASAAQ